MSVDIRASSLISYAQARRITASMYDRAAATPAEREDVMRGLLSQYGISLGDLGVLSALAANESASIGTLSRHLAMGRREAVWHVCRLIRAGLAEVSFGVHGDRAADTVTATQTGHVLSSIVAA